VTGDQHLLRVGQLAGGGRWFLDEIQVGAAVCIIGETTRQELLGSADPIGARLRLRSLSCTVVGLLESKGKNTFGMDRDDTVVVPLRTLQRRLTGSEDIQQIQLSVRTGSRAKAQQDIYRLMRDRRNLAPEADDDFNIMDQQEIAGDLRHHAHLDGAAGHGGGNQPCSSAASGS
jgi:putative ABC transport system permease protein